MNIPGLGPFGAAVGRRQKSFNAKQIQMNCRISCSQKENLTKTESLIKRVSCCAVMVGPISI
jgi:hypothetical protein